MAALGVLGVVLARPFQPTGEVAGIAGTPGSGATRHGAIATADEPPDPTGNGGARARSDSTKPPSTPRPATPTSTVAPTPLRTDQPTPRPTSRPTPAPTPRGCVAIAPDLIGQPRSSAARLWHAAGFTGSVTTLPGHGNYEIASQDPTPGKRVACTASVTVGP